MLRQLPELELAPGGEVPGDHLVVDITPIRHPCRDSARIVEHGIDRVGEPAIAAVLAPDPDLEAPGDTFLQSREDRPHRLDVFRVHEIEERGADQVLREPASGLRDGVGDPDDDAVGVAADHDLGGVVRQQSEVFLRLLQLVHDPGLLGDVHDLRDELGDGAVPVADRADAEITHEGRSVRSEVPLSQPVGVDLAAHHALDLGQVDL
ncbi:MAG: hypothetical protein U0R64_05355 [Candidatus Nanopelagicales bacterium]